MCKYCDLTKPQRTAVRDLRNASLPELLALKKLKLVKLLLKVRGNSPSCVEAVFQYTKEGGLLKELLDLKAPLSDDMGSALVWLYKGVENAIPNLEVLQALVHYGYVGEALPSKLTEKGTELAKKILAVADELEEDMANKLFNTCKGVDLDTAWNLKGVVGPIVIPCQRGDFRYHDKDFDYCGDVGRHQLPDTIAFGVYMGGSGD